MWISSKTVIGNTSDADYDMDEWDDVFASIKVNVTGDFNEKVLEEEEKITLVDEVKSKLVKYEESSKESFSGGLVAINTDGTLYNETNNETIREYRYSGNTVNNYVRFNNEIWRIIGVFKDENEIEKVKIIKDKYLSKNIFPDTYTVSNIKYKINGSVDYEDVSNDVAYWNLKVDGETDTDWTTAGLQYWLNTENDDNSENKGYLSYLQTDYKNMIEKTKFYLGNFYFFKKYMGAAPGWSYSSDNAITAYNHERGSTICDNSIKNQSYGQDGLSGCNVWFGNKSTWDGFIGLLYISDFGYSMPNNNWDLDIYTSMGWGAGHPSGAQNSWLIDKLSFFISPSSSSLDKILYDDDSISVNTAATSVYPTLYLKNNVKITSGNGTEQQPYELSGN